MNSWKKRVKEETEPIEKKPPLFQRKRFNLIYTIVMIFFIVAGMTLVLVFSTAVPNDAGFIGGLALSGIAIILFTSRSTFKHTAVTQNDKKDEDKEDDEGLQMRRR